MKVSGTLLSIFVTLVNNLIYLSNSILIQEFDLWSGEVFFYQAVLNTIIYSIFAGLEWIKATESRRFGFYVIGMAVLGNIFFGVMIQMVMISCKMLPISEFVTLTFTSPAFTLILSRIILR